MATDVSKTTPIKLTGHLEKRKAGKPFSVEMEDGRVFTIADVKSFPLKTLQSLDGLSQNDALSLLMGAEEYQAFLDHPEVDGYFVEEFGEEWRKHAGLPGGPGESPASSA